MNKLYLHKEIYLRTAEEETLHAFKNIAEIVLEESENYYCLTFNNCKADPYIATKEFGNYALTLTIQSAGDLYD